MNYDLRMAAQIASEIQLLEHKRLSAGYRRQLLGSLRMILLRIKNSN